MTIDQIFQDCYQKHWSKSRFVASGHQREVFKLYQNNIREPLGPIAAISMSPKLIREWHEGLESTPTSANRSLEVLSRLFTFAQERELIPWQHANPCQFVKANVERQRERVATEEELQRIGQVLLRRAEKNPRAAAFVILLALTGARPKSVMKLRCNIVQEGKAMVIKFDGKTSADSGRKETVVIPPLALKILKRLQPRADGLLIGPVRYREFWDGVRKEAGCPDVWARDFRRFFAQVAISNGVTSGAVGEILSQKSAQTVMRYARIMESSRVTVATLVSDKLAKIMELRV